MRPEEGSKTTPFLELKNMMKQRERRGFIRAGLVAGVSTFAGARLLRTAEAKKPGEEEQEEEVSPSEDLMQEHGVL